MTRFFVEPEAFLPDFMVLTGENASHAKVLRLKCGEEVIVCDGQGREAVCAISDISPDQISLAVLHQQTAESEASVSVSVYMAFSKGDKFEHVIQKATELGAYEIVAFPSARCVSRPDEKSLKKKLERWQKIAESAAKQCGQHLPFWSVCAKHNVLASCVMNPFWLGRRFEVAGSKQSYRSTGLAIMFVRVFIPSYRKPERSIWSTQYKYTAVFTFFFFNLLNISFWGLPW